jgi:hypothetical protein
MTESLEDQVVNGVERKLEGKREARGNGTRMGKRKMKGNVLLKARGGGGIGLFRGGPVDCPLEQILEWCKSEPQGPPKGLPKINLILLAAVDPEGSEQL